MREGTTSRVTVADRPYGEFYDFYSVSPENFGSTLVLKLHAFLTLALDGGERLTSVPSHLSNYATVIGPYQFN